LPIVCLYEFVIGVTRLISPLAVEGFHQPGSLLV
jgi:hypothetical protein